MVLPNADDRGLRVVNPVRAQAREQDASTGARERLVAATLQLLRTTVTYRLTPNTRILETWFRVREPYLYSCVPCFLLLTLRLTFFVP
jgi:hypothetical protein